MIVVNPTSCTSIFKDRRKVLKNPIFTKKFFKDENKITLYKN